MDKTESTMAQQLAEVAKHSNAADGPRTTRVAVVMSEDTLVVTLHEALTPAERRWPAARRGRQGAGVPQQLFRNSADSLRKEIERITGRKVREAAAEVDPATGSVVHAFTTGTTCRCFCLMAGCQPTRWCRKDWDTAITSEVLNESFRDEGTSC